MHRTSYSFQILIKLQFSRKVVEKFSNIEYNGNAVSGSSVVPFGQTNMIKLTIAFRSFAGEFNK